VRRYVLHIIDTDPLSLSANGWLEDTSKVQKYEMSDEDYAQRENTYRKFKEKKLQARQALPSPLANGLEMAAVAKDTLIASCRMQRAADAFKPGIGGTFAEAPVTTAGLWRHSPLFDLLAACRRTRSGR